MSGIMIGPGGAAVFAPTKPIEFHPPTPGVVLGPPDAKDRRIAELLERALAAEERVAHLERRLAATSEGRARRLVESLGP